jgi:hypothetical protein
MTDLSQYLEEIVGPTIEDFQQNPTSRRHAFLACVAVCHAVDYLAYPKGPRDLRQRFCHESADFKIVDEVGHAFKHVVVGRRNDPRLKASEVISRPPADWEKASWDLSRWDDPVGGVTLDAERTVDLLDAVKNAVTFLWTQVEISLASGTSG